MPTIGKIKAKVIEKVTCSLCGVFAGFIHNDGKGPIFDQCSRSANARVDHAEVQALLREGDYRGAERFIKEHNLQPPPCPLEEKLAPYQPRTYAVKLAENKGNRHNRNVTRQDERPS